MNNPDSPSPPFLLHQQTLHITFVNLPSFTFLLWSPCLISGLLWGHKTKPHVTDLWERFALQQHSARFLSSSSCNVSVTWIQKAFRHLTSDRTAVYVEQKIYCQSSLSGTFKDIMAYFIGFWPFGVQFFFFLLCTVIYRRYVDLWICFSVRVILAAALHALEETISLIDLFVFLFQKQMYFMAWWSWRWMQNERCAF